MHSGPRRSAPGPKEEGSIILPNTIMDWAQQGDPHACLGHSREKTLTYLVPCTSRQAGTIMVSKCMVCYRKDRDRQNVSCPVYKGIYKEVTVVRNGPVSGAWLPPKARVISGPELSGFMAEIQPQSVLMFKAPDTMKDRRTVQIWICCSLTATLGRTGPAPHWLKQSGERILYLTCNAQYSWTCSQWHGRADPEGMRMREQVVPLS